MGKGSLAIRIAEWFIHSREWDLAAIVPVIPEPQWTLSLANWARGHKIRLVASGDYRDIPLKCLPDLALSVFYGKILPTWFIAQCGKAINIHNGPLPRYRGVSPINWALKNGETEHGVTIHEITEKIDAGPIISQVKFSIYPDRDEVIDVYNRCLEFGWTLFLQTMPILDKVSTRPQDESQALYYSRADDERLGDRRSFRREVVNA